MGSVLKSSENFLDWRRWYRSLSAQNYFSVAKYNEKANLDHLQGEQVVDARETPEEVALKFQSREFETPQDVLKGARHMVWHIACFTSAIHITKFSLGYFVLMFLIFVLFVGCCRD